MASELPPDVHLPTAPDEDPFAVLKEIRRTLRVLVISTVVLALALLGVALYVYLNSEKSNDALCALRGELEGRVATQTQFLVDHPNGIPGIPADVIRTQLENTKASVGALSGLSC